MIQELKETLLQFGLEWFGRYYSTYKGEIVDNEDPEFLGRVKIKCAEIYGDDSPDYWAWPRGMFAGNQIGLFAIPDRGDSIWVSFENGDPRFPLWEYGTFKNKEVPDAAKVDGLKPRNIILQSKTKHRIELDDKNELVRVTDSHGNIAEFNKTGISLVSKKIALGTLDGAAEPVVLGFKNTKLHKDHLNDLKKSLQELQKYCTTQQGVASSVVWLAPLAPGYVVLKTALMAIEQDVDTLISNAPKTESKQNTTD